MVFSLRQKKRDACVSVLPFCERSTNLSHFESSGNSVPRPKHAPRFLSFPEPAGGPGRLLLFLSMVLECRNWVM